MRGDKYCNAIVLIEVFERLEYPRYSDKGITLSSNVMKAINPVENRIISKKYQTRSNFRLRRVKSEKFSQRISLGGGAFVKYQAFGANT